MYSQTIATRFDCKKLLRFALATLCLLALALFMPVAARAEENTVAAKLEETGTWKAQKDNTTYATFERNGSANEEDRNQGKVRLEVYVMKPGKTAYSDSSVDGVDYDKYTTDEFYYQYNAHEDQNLKFHPDSRTFDKLEQTDKDKKGTGKGGYGSLDLKVTAGAGYTIYRVDYSVCYSSEGPTKTGWKTEKFDVNKNVDGPTSFCYLDNIQDNTTAKVYLMPAYTVQYKVVDKDGNSADLSTYNVADGSMDAVTGVLPYKENLDNIKGCNVLQGIESYEYNTGSIAPYHRWCSAANEEEAVKLVKDRLKYEANTSVTLPQLAAADGYSVSGWTHGGKEYSGTLDLSTLSAEEFAALANDTEHPLTITLTAVVTDKTPENTDNNGNNNGNGDNGGNNGGDNNNNGGNNGNNGGQESTPTPTPVTTPAPTASVTTVTAVAPTATPTATPDPTAEPTATPAPAAVSVHIPQTSDDMPYMLLVVTALASLCAAGVLFMKRRSK